MKSNLRRLGPRTSKLADARYTSVNESEICAHSAAANVSPTTFKHRLIDTMRMALEIEVKKGGIQPHDR